MPVFDPRREITPPLRLGELALRAGLISQAQLKVALSQQGKEATSGRLPRQLGLILLSLGFLAEGDLIQLIAEQEKLKAPSLQTGPQVGATRENSSHALHGLPTLGVPPSQGSGGSPPLRK